MKALTDLVDQYGLPEKIISDRGSCFTSHELEKYCKENGIEQTLNSTQHPQGNGMVERVNRTVLPVIMTSMTHPEHKDWDKKIKQCERNLNNVVNNTSGRTPFEMLHGYSPRFNDGILRRLADEDAENWTAPEEVQAEARKRIEERQEQAKKYYDQKKKCRTMTFDPGEIVVVRRSPRSTGEPNKTQPRYRGPLVITEVLPNDTYRISQLEEKEKGRFYSTTAHVNQLKAWRCERSSDDDESDVTDRESPPKRNPRRIRRIPARYRD